MATAIITIADDVTPAGEPSLRFDLTFDGGAGPQLGSKAHMVAALLYERTLAGAVLTPQTPRPPVAAPEPGAHD